MQQGHGVKPNINRCEPHLVTKLILDVTFHPAQHERLQDDMKATELMLVQVIAFVFGGIFYVFREPFVEFIVRIKEAGHDEVE